MARKQMDHFARLDAAERNRIDSAIGRINYVMEKIPTDVRDSDMGPGKFLKLYEPFMELSRYKHLYKDEADERVKTAYAQMYSRMERYVCHIFRVAELNLNMFDPEKDEGRIMVLLSIAEISREMGFHFEIGKHITARILTAKLGRN